MPLAQITGVTGVNTTFNIAWALLKDEQEGSHRWYLDQLRRIGTARQIRTPMVIVSDLDNAFRGACQEVFPEANTQLCIWHMMKNVAFHIKIKWSGSLKETELGRRMAA